jgi:hypothetical protein
MRKDSVAALLLMNTSTTDVADATWQRHGLQAKRGNAKNCQ